MTTFKEILDISVELVARGDDPREVIENAMLGAAHIEGVRVIGLLEDLRDSDANKWSPYYWALEEAIRRIGKVPA